MKSLLLVVLTGLLSALFFGCNSNSSEGDAAAPGKVHTTAYAPATKEAPEPTAEAQDQNQVETNRVIQIDLRSAKHYHRPFVEAEFGAIITRPDGSEVRIPGFWEGPGQWAFRYSSNQPGTHSWRGTSTDPASDLNHTSGTIEVVAAGSENPLYEHGQLRIAEDQRHFEHVDGTPFFWLGDTQWKCLCGRMPWEGFQELAADRAEKGFTVVQIVCGPVPDEPTFQPSWGNEGGMPYLDPTFTQVNPEFFHYADRRLELLVDSGIVPAIVGCWARPDCNGLAMAGEEGIKRHWRNVVARYGAYPTIWVISGESLEPEWIPIARYVKELDAYDRPLSTHPSFGMREQTKDDPIVNFEMLGSPHGGWEGSLTSPGILQASLVVEPHMPALISETSYEQHMQEGYADQQRYLFWTSILTGAAGHTYGAAGVWNAGVPGDPGIQNVYDRTTWRAGMNFEGSTQLGLGKDFLMQYPWERFEPHPEWTEEGSYAAGIPGELRFIYMPKRGIYNWGGAHVHNLEAGMPYRATYFDPITGEQLDYGVVLNGGVLDDITTSHTEPVLFADDFATDDAAAWTDHGTPTERVDGQLVSFKETRTTYNDFNEADAMVSVSAKSDAEAGIILRYYDDANYLVGFYSPQNKKIFWHERQDDHWGLGLGQVEVPEIGEDIQLTAIVEGGHAVLILTDGVRTYHTPAITVENTEPGRVGLWHFQVGDRQQFDNFQVSRSPLPGVAEFRESGADHFALNGMWEAAPAPSPQDWLLVLERVQDETTTAAE